MNSLALSLSWEKICKTVNLSYTKRSTGVLVVLCPFHYERTPSLHMWPQSGEFHCHGCGTSGNQKEFLVKATRVVHNYPEIFEGDIYHLIDTKGQLLLSLPEGENQPLF